MDDIVDEWFDLNSIEDDHSSHSVQFHRWSSISCPTTALLVFEKYAASLKPRTRVIYEFWQKTWYTFCSEAVVHVAINIDKLLAFERWLIADRAAREISLGMSHFCNCLSAISFLAQEQFCQARAAVADAASSPDALHAARLFLTQLQDPRPVYESMIRMRMQAYNPFSPENLAALARYAPGGLKLRHFKAVCKRLLERPRPDTGLREWAFVTQLLAGLHRGHEVISGRLIQFGVYDEVNEVV